MRRTHNTKNEVNNALITKSMEEMLLFYRTTKVVVAPQRWHQIWATASTSQRSEMGIVQWIHQKCLVSETDINGMGRGMAIGVRCDKGGVWVWETLKWFLAHNSYQSYRVHRKAWTEASAGTSTNFFIWLSHKRHFCLLLSSTTVIFNAASAGCHPYLRFAFNKSESVVRNSVSKLHF